MNLTITETDIKKFNLEIDECEFDAGFCPPKQYVPPPRTTDQNTIVSRTKAKTYDDILAKLNMTVIDGKLHIARGDEPKQTLHTQTIPALRAIPARSAIPTPVVKPIDIAEYRKNVASLYLEELRRVQRLKALKGKGLLFHCYTHSEVKRYSAKPTDFRFSPFFGR